MPTPPLQASITLRSPSTRTALSAAMNERLADVTQLMGHTRAAHWNVRGEHAFLPIHRMLDGLACALHKTQDCLAGRIRILGGHVTGNLQPPPTPRIPAYPVEITSVEDILREISIGLAVLIGLLRITRDFAKEKDDRQTAEALTGKLKKLEKKGRRFINSMPEAAATQAMSAAQAALGGVQNAAGGSAGKKSVPGSAKR